MIINLIIDIIINLFVSYKQYGVGDVSTLSSGFGVLLFYLLAILSIFLEKHQNRNSSLFFKLYIIGIIIIPLSFFIPMIGRLDMYFTFSAIIVFPNIILTFRKQLYKLLFTTIIIFFTLYQFFNFFTNETYGKFYSNYNTIFSHIFQ